MVKNHIAPTPTPLVQKRIENIPPGGCVRNLPKQLLPARFRQQDYFKNVCTGHSVLRRLTMEGTAPTILASTGDDSMLIHPYLQRCLTLREKARLQAFPDTYEFVGTYSSVHRQIGNAVPVLLARQLGVALKGW